MTTEPRRPRPTRQNVGAAWEKLGTGGTFLALEIDADAALADSLAAVLRGEERIAYLAFINEKKPDGRDGQPDHRIVRPLRRGASDAA